MKKTKLDVSKLKEEDGKLIGGFSALSQIQMERVNGSGNNRCSNSDCGSGSRPTTTNSGCYNSNCGINTNVSSCTNSSCSYPIPNGMMCNPEMEVD